jgi:hypothetical protein
MYELTERFEQLASCGLPPRIEREFLQMLVDNPAILWAIPRELQQMVVDALKSGECRTNA